MAAATPGEVALGCPVHADPRPPSWRRGPCPGPAVPAALAQPWKRAALKGAGAPVGGAGVQLQLLLGCWAPRPPCPLLPTEAWPSGWGYPWLGLAVPRLQRQGCAEQGACSLPGLAEGRRGWQFRTLWKEAENSHHRSVFPQTVPGAGPCSGSQPQNWAKRSTLPRDFLSPPKPIQHHSFAVPGDHGTLGGVE